MLPWNSTHWQWSSPLHPAAFLHSLWVFLKHKAPTTCLITPSLSDCWILLSVRGAQQDTGSPLLDPVLCLSHSAVSQILLEMFWESENYNSLGAVLWARVRCSPRRLKMHQIGIGHFSRETYDGENCKTHNSSFCCTSTRGTNSQNTLKDQL